jgi:hypothetical protein
MRHGSSLALLLAVVALAPTVSSGTSVEAAGIHASIALDLRPSRAVTPGAILAARREATALWRPAGVQVGPPALAGAVAVRVVFVGSLRSVPGDEGLPLGRLEFADDRPVPRIDVYGDAVRWTALRAARPALPGPGWTSTESDRLIGRVLGRVIAHELGHYLLGSAEHTASGLMKAGHSPSEFAAESRAAFRLSGIVAGPRFALAQ